MSRISEKKNEFKCGIESNKRAIKLLSEISPHLVLCEIMNGIIKGVFPFVEITFSAMIINELAGERNVNNLVRLVLFSICSLLLLGVLRELLNKIITAKKETFDERHEIFLNNYSYNMDFQKIEDSDTAELRDRIEGIMDTESGGLKIISTYLGELCQNAASVIIACSICFKMLFCFDISSDKHPWITSHWFTMAFLFVLVVCIYGTAFFSRKMKKKMFQATMEGTKYNRYICYYLWEYLDDNMYAKDIRIFDQSEIVTREMEEKGFKAWVGIFKACEKLEKKYGGLNSFLSAIMSGIVYIFVTLRALAGTISIGNVVKYYGTITELIRAISGIAVTITAINNNNLYLNLVFEYIDYGKDVHEGTEEVHPKKDGTYEFEFRNVSFKYTGTDEYALKNLSFKIKDHERLAVVGMNGSGKTTMIKLLCGFYQPDEGYITFNGTDIWKLDYKEYKKLFSVVFQDFRLLGFSVGENVTVSHKYDNQRVWDVLEKVGIKNRVEQLEYQLDNSVYKQFDDRGVDISGGEEQKIAIARALYRNAEVYILDEPTAALDPESEYEIYSKMNEITQGNTVIFISHRLSSCCYSDNIIVFHKGEMVQNGKHDELLKDEKGKYFELWNAQSQHYKDEEVIEA
ncbi:ABC transporter related [Clostridium putrefaciens]|uniref:ABC transporter related n=1 Tax=Clostridium putrefaciens TaxID=99675 RepID=A0A381J9P8_9CLOT|nr:ABC transporter ATP-binding protein [Clostridium putrefaciens]SUY47137.1 ABC transporter related [Clostridium putrefaciens]